MKYKNIQIYKYIKLIYLIFKRRQAFIWVPQTSLDVSDSLNSSLKEVPQVGRLFSLFQCKQNFNRRNSSSHCAILV